MWPPYSMTTRGKADTIFEDPGINYASDILI